MISPVRRRRVSPNTVALFLNVLVLAVLTALMAAGVERTLTARSIESRIANLRDNLTQLIQARQNRLVQLGAELDQARSDLAAAEAGTPHLGAPYQLYQRGFAMGPGTGVEVQSIEYRGAEQQDTALGPLVLQTYAITLAGDMDSCVAYLRQLEADGKPFLATDRVNLQGESQACSFDATVLGTDTSGRPVGP